MALQKIVDSMRTTTALDATKLSGTVTPAADTVTGAKIADNAVDSEHYTDGSIDAAHLSANSIDSASYVDGSIDLAHLSADSVDGTKIADDALDSEHYTNGSVDDVHIAGMAASKLTGTITPSDNTVTGAKIALGSDAAGDIMYYNGTNYIRLAKGSAAQLLTINSGATAPEWTTSSGATIQQVTAKAVTMAIALG